MTPGDGLSGSRGGLAEAAPATPVFVKPLRAVDRVFIHCSASDNPDHDDVSVIRKWHLARDFNDIGYHYFIRKDGTVQGGRSTELTPAAQQGHNKGTIAICCHGLDEANFTIPQFKSLITLCQLINKAYAGKVTFHGHREVAAKACPVFDYATVLGLVVGRMAIDPNPGYRGAANG
jgi:hypothetical protein